MEQKEIDILIGRGLSFEVEQTTYKKHAGVIGYFSKPVKVVETVQYTIQEPTLSTLDRIAAEQIHLNVDESIIATDNGLSEVRRLASEHCNRMARILALAVLGQDYVITVNTGASVRYRFDEKRLKVLTDVFFHSIKPSKLFKLCILINSISNLGDFTNSIRLMSANRTTMPSRIEVSGD